jgi:hypothetical protein
MFLFFLALVVGLDTLLLANPLDKTATNTKFTRRTYIFL